MSTNTAYKFNWDVVKAILYFSCWFGLLTGLVEGIGLFTLQRAGLMSGDIRFLGASYEALPVSAFSNLLLFFLVGLFLSAIHFMAPGISIKKIALFIFSCLLALDWLLMVLAGRISKKAIPVLALGLAFQLFQWLNRREARFLAFVKKTSKWLVSFALIATMVILGGARINEYLIVKKLPPAQATDPNILVIVIDTLRADHLSLHGYDRETDPYLKRLAQEGVWFENAYSASSWTLPSHASMITGRWPHEHQMDAVPFNTAPILLGNRFTTIAEALQARGYQTAAFSGNYVNFSKIGGLGRGFSHFEDSYQSVENLLVNSIYGKMTETYIFHRLFNMQYAPDRKLAEDINQHTLNWIDQNTDRPFFVFINYFDVHSPYIPPQPFRSQFSSLENPGGLINTDWDLTHIYVPMTPEQLQGEIDAYDGSIAYTDYQIQSLLTELDARGKLDNTLVIITSDHGESFGEHGLLEHHNSLYPEVIHVPLIVWWPQQIQPGLRVDTPVSNVSLPATILDLIDDPAQDEFPVRSLVDLWTGSVNPNTWYYPIAEVTQAIWLPPQHLPSSGSMKSVITPVWQYIEHDQLGVELYNHAEDPQELQNLAPNTENRSVIEKLKDYLNDLLK